MPVPIQQLDFHQNMYIVSDFLKIVEPVGPRGQNFIGSGISVVLVGPTNVSVSCRMNVYIPTRNEINRDVFSNLILQVCHWPACTLGVHRGLYNSEIENKS